MLIRLPALKGSEKLSPYEQLYSLCAKRLGRPIASVSDVSVNKKTGKILSENESDWQWKNWDKKFMGKPYFMKKYFPMHWLNYSPREQEDIPDGKAEIKEVHKKSVKGS